MLLYITSSSGTSLTDKWSHSKYSIFTLFMTIISNLSASMISENQRILIFLRKHPVSADSITLHGRNHLHSSQLLAVSTLSSPSHFFLTSLLHLIKFLVFLAIPNRTWVPPPVTTTKSSSKDFILLFSIQKY